jgi:hypothetical protein
MSDMKLSMPGRRALWRGVFARRRLAVGAALVVAALAWRSPATARAVEPDPASLAPRLSQAVGFTSAVTMQPGRYVSSVTSSTTTVFYSATYLAGLQRRLGAAAVAGVLLHELGHLRRGQPSMGHPPDARAELAADEEAGCALARLQLPVGPYLAALPAAAHHGVPQASLPGRRAAAQRGHRTCAGGADLDRARPLVIRRADVTSDSALALANSGLAEMVRALKADARFRLSTPYSPGPAPSGVK